MEASRLKVGDTVLAKVTTGWQSPDCVLREGAVLKGRVVAQSNYSKSKKSSQVALLFDNAECGGPALVTFPLTVAAVLGGDPRIDSGAYEDQPLNEAVGVVLRGGTRSLSSAAETVFQEPSRYRGRTEVKPGEVVGIKGVQLQVGAGPEGSSILSSLGHNLRLDAGLVLVLVQNINATVPAVTPSVDLAPGPSDTRGGVKPEELLEAPDESDSSAPPQCSQAVGDINEQASPAISATFPIKDLSLGRSQRDLSGFDYDSAIAYLGENRLLFTYNPHVLISRLGPEGTLSKLRTIRAVLFDVSTRKILKTMDWKVADDRQYLWPLGQNKILAHVGRDLRVYGADLRLEQRVPLGGPLAFVRVSPSSKYFAVGVILERHVEAIHRELEDAEQREPEEDVEIRILDEHFQSLASIIRSSRAKPPALSDHGEFGVERGTRNRWEIVENTWDLQKRAVTRVHSTCRPQVTTFSPGLIFLVGCDRQTDGRWYRVLRPDGKPVLKGWFPTEELEPRVAGTADEHSFSIGIAQASKSLTPGSFFREGDIKSQHIAVFRTNDGERLFAVTLRSPLATVQTFSLSPDGDQLAVLEADRIALYRVGGAHQ
jgi:hypothetical protein